MVNTTVKVYRSGQLVPLMSGIMVQIDTANLDMLAVDGGAGDYDTFDIYCKWANPDIRRGDILQDEANGTDNYEVTNRPEQFPNGSCQIRAILKIGN